MQVEPYLSEIIKAQDNSAMAKAKLNKRRHKNIHYESDGLTAKYIVNPEINGDTVSLQCEQPIQSSFFYFEVKILRKDVKSYISIGVALENYPNNKQLGFTSGSIGYSMDGKVYSKKQETEFKMNAFKQDDIIGCGISKQELFFTHNSMRSVQSIKVDFKEPIYPTVCVYGEVTLKFNFGASPFIYDYSKTVQREKQDIMGEISKQEVSPYSLHLIIQEYLWSQGYLSTLKQFERESSLQENENMRLEKRVDEDMAYGEEIDYNKMTPMSSLQRKMSGLQSPNFQQISSIERKVSGFYLDDGDQLNQIAEQAFLKDQLVNQDRQRIQNLIRDGNIGKVIDILQETLPSFLHKQGIHTTLYSQYFIELMKRDKVQEAIVLGQMHLSQNLPFSVECVDENHNPIKMKVENILGLICYDNIQQSILKGLVSQQQRERVCDYINKNLLVELGYEDESALEICLKQLQQVCDQIHSHGLLGSHQVQFQ